MLSKFSRRDMLKLTAGMTAGAVLAGCAPAATPTEVPAAPATAAPVATQAPQATQAPEATKAAEPTATAAPSPSATPGLMLSVTLNEPSVRAGSVPIVQVMTPPALVMGRPLVSPAYVV